MLSFLFSSSDRLSSHRRQAFVPPLFLPTLLVVRILKPSSFKAFLTGSDEV
ncbi:hypothetical protein IAE16_00525 [Hydrogenobacter sp. T-2]|uniref:hypothetical protein n=1 Tax=Pampinifervens diazotrophicum TaxID=1632018 RepID=UPI002B25A222|nr:hypothetical protein [Hydrogenobacter sp. T-2]WPM32182.1 hypothetical protein IAE16_00525 [Hydrogenobacter sp. T-2]